MIVQATIMDGGQVPVHIFRSQDLESLSQTGLVSGKPCALHDQIPFVYYAVPYVPVRTNAGHQITQVTFIIRRAIVCRIPATHAIKAPVPSVIRVENYEISLHVRILQLHNALVKPLPKRYIEARKIPCRWPGSFICEKLWFYMVISYHLGNIVIRILLNGVARHQASHSLRDERIVLVNPRV